MNLFSKIFLAYAALFFSLTAIGSPAWLDSHDAAFEVPKKLSDAEQGECANIIIAEINREFESNFNQGSIAKVQLGGWKKTEQGFIRGGGYNIRIVQDLPMTDAKNFKIRAGRFGGRRNILFLGAKPSLHIPDEIDGFKMFHADKTADESFIHYDFIAHMDSAYAYLPLGLIYHLVVDVLGANTRSACPNNQ